jgi:hypothetical protein
VFERHLADGSVAPGDLGTAWLLQFYVKDALSEEQKEGTGLAELREAAKLLAGGVGRKNTVVKIGRVDILSNEFLATRFGKKGMLSASDSATRRHDLSPHYVPELALLHYGRMFHYPYDVEQEAEGLVHFVECCLSPGDSSCKQRISSKAIPPAEAAMYPISVKTLEASNFDTVTKSATATPADNSGDWLIHFYSSRVHGREHQRMFDDAAEALREGSGDKVTVARVNMHPLGRNAALASRFKFTLERVEANDGLIFFFRHSKMWRWPDGATVNPDSLVHFVECAQHPDDALCKAGVIFSVKVPGKTGLLESLLTKLGKLIDSTASKIERTLIFCVPEEFRNETFGYGIVSISIAAVFAMIFGSAEEQVELHPSATSSKKSQ